MHLSADEAANVWDRPILDSIGHAVIATDLNGEIVFWNAGAEKIYGWAERDALGKHILDVTPTRQSREQTAAIFDKLLKGESWSGAFEVRDNNGRWFPG